MTSHRLNNGVPERTSAALADHRPIVLVHTPKCAGKALRAALESGFGDRLCLHYSNPLKMGLSRRVAQRARGELANHRELRRCACVFGHFSLGRYRRSIRAGDVRTGMFFREPLDLLVSYYFYHLGKRRSDAERLDEHAAGVLQLAGRPFMRGFYRRFLGGLDPRELDYVGLYEELGRSLALFGALYDIEPRPRRSNVTRARPGDARSYLQEVGILERVETLMGDNRSCYRRAGERFSDLCVRAGIDGKHI